MVVAAVVEVTPSLSGGSSKRPCVVASLCGGDSKTSCVGASVMPSLSGGAERRIGAAAADPPRRLWTRTTVASTAIAATAATQAAAATASVAPRPPWLTLLSISGAALLSLSCPCGLPPSPPSSSPEAAGDGGEAGSVVRVAASFPGGAAAELATSHAVSAIAQ